MESTKLVLVEKWEFAAEAAGREAEYLWWPLPGTHNSQCLWNCWMTNLISKLPSPWGIVQQKDTLVCPETLLSNPLLPTAMSISLQGPVR